jgi:hypothetical protein
MAVSLDTGAYYSIAEPFTLPADDWCVGMWVRRPNGLVSSEFNWALSHNNSNVANAFHFLLWGPDSGNPGSAVTNVYSNDGTGVFDFDFNVGVAAYSTWQLLIVQRRSFSVQTYLADLGSTVSGPNGSVGYTSNEIIVDGLYIGRADPVVGTEHNWRNELAELFIINNASLSLAEINALLAGVNIAEVYPTPLANLRFLGSNATEEDLTGNGYDAIRTGTPAVVDHPFDENILVSYLGDGEVELGGDATVEFFEGTLVDYTGVGELDFSGAAVVQEFNPANVLVEYTGEGEVLLTGEATAEIVNTLLLVEFEGSGGLGFSGSADSFTPPMITGSGGMILTGSARITNAPGNPYLPNDRWTNNVSLQAEFLYGRLLHQKKNFGSRDSIVYIEGIPQAEVTPVLCNCLYDVTSGEVRLYVAGATTYDVLFIEPELVKLDLTFDVNGRPVVVYQVGIEVWLHQYDTDIEDYTEFKIADGTQPFVCWDERREEYVTTGDILVVYKKDTSIYMRKSRDDFELEYATSVLNRATDDFTIQGFGMTVTHRMQIRVLITKVLED